MGFKKDPTPWSVSLQGAQPLAMHMGTIHSSVPSSGEASQVDPHRQASAAEGSPQSADGFSSDPGDSPGLCAVKAYLDRDRSLTNILNSKPTSQSNDSCYDKSFSSGSPSPRSSLASSPLTRPSLGCVSLR